jgi:ERCC4-type nuclease
MTYSDPSPWFVVLLGVAWAGAQLWERAAPVVDRVREKREPSAMERLKTQYETTDMDHDEFSRRVDDLLDPGEQDIRERVEDVSGVGPAVAGEVAEHFESVEHVRQADREELQQVPDVGPSRSESIHRHFS